MPTAAGRLRDLRSDRGSAVVEFPLIAVLIIAIAVTIIQAAIIVHTRNSLTDIAVQAAHAASLHGSTPAEGQRRATELLSQRLGRGYTARAVVRESFDGMITVEITATMPLVGLLGPEGALHATGHALDEDTT